MAITNYQVVTNSFLRFASHAKHILHLHSKQDYENALTLVEFLFDTTADSQDDPLNDLITIVSNAITEYESKDKSLDEFNRKLIEVDSSIATLRVLMDQYDLTGSDFQVEIGSKSLVSMILSGERNLTKEHIINLSQRFNINPALFFK